MTVFGNTAMFIDTVWRRRVGRCDFKRRIVGLFRFFEYLPFSGITSTLAVLLVCIFFITSADSVRLLSIRLRRRRNRNDHRATRLLVLNGRRGCSCLLMAGGLSALQSATVASALPFTFVMLALVVSHLSRDAARSGADGGS